MLSCVLSEAWIKRFYLRKERPRCTVRARVRFFDSQQMAAAHDADQHWLPGCTCGTIKLHIQTLVASRNIEDEKAEHRSRPKIEMVQSLAFELDADYVYI